MLLKLMNYYAAGSMGALVNSFTVWIFGLLGINTLLGVTIAPALTPGWLYPRIVWGGLWGLTLILLKNKERMFLKALIVSLAPTLVQLFIIFPYKAKKGMLGLDLGALTPLLVIFFNYVFAYVALHFAKFDNTGEV